MVKEQQTKASTPKLYIYCAILDGDAYFMGKVKTDFQGKELWKKRIFDVIEENGGINAVSRTTGIHRNTLGNWMNNDIYPTADKLSQFCSALGISADYLLGMTSDNNYSNDEIIRMTTEYTGLSNQAINVLHSINYLPKDAHPIHHLSENIRPVTAAFKGKNVHEALSFINRVFDNTDSLYGCVNLFAYMEQYIKGVSIKSCIEAITIQTDESNDDAWTFTKGELFYAAMGEKIINELGNLRALEYDKKHGRRNNDGKHETDGNK